MVLAIIIYWETGFSVPDADMLQKLADILEVDVKQLLGTEIETEQERNELAEQLARINEQLVIKNRRSSRIWKVIGWGLTIVLLFNILLAIFGTVTSTEPNTTATENQVQQIDD